MSLQWTLVATILYVEIAVVLLLILPIASPQKWQKVFKSRFLHYVSNQAYIFFFISVGILVLCLLDAVREMRKYSHLDASDSHNLNVELQGHMKLFRAQRNFYISGFALFLLVVIRRLVHLISGQAVLLAQVQANLRQAQSASTAARSLLAQKGAGEAAQNDSNEAHDAQVNKLKSQISILEEQLEKEKTDKAALKSQADSLNREYDRLTDEHSKALKKIAVTGGATLDKKDD